MERLALVGAEAQGWDRRRYATLTVVAALHVALLTALLQSSLTPPLAAAAKRPLELLYLPPAPPAKIIPENFRPHRIGSDIDMAIAPALLGTLPMAAANSGADGNGHGVDWGAEARRAMQAFEIRNARSSSTPTPSTSSAGDDWWPHAQHHAGEQYKTDTGDWIVWINSSCYQVAKAAAAYVPGAVLPETICPGQNKPPP